MRRRKFRRGGKEWAGGCFLSRVITEGLTEKVALEQRPEGSEGANQSQGQEHSRHRNQQVQRPQGRRAPGEIVSLAGVSGEVIEVRGQVVRALWGI